MFVLDLLGAVLTLLTLALLAAAGYLLARLVLRERAAADPLALAAASLLAATAEAEAIGLALGKAGVLWIPLGLAVLAAAVLVLWRWAKAAGDPWRPAGLLFVRI